MAALRQPAGSLSTPFSNPNNSTGPMNHKKIKTSRLAPRIMPTEIQVPQRNHQLVAAGPQYQRSRLNVREVILQGVVYGVQYGGGGGVDEVGVVETLQRKVLARGRLALLHLTLDRKNFPDSIMCLSGWIPHGMLRRSSLGMHLPESQSKSS